MSNHHLFTLRYLAEQRSEQFLREAAEQRRTADLRPGRPARPAWRRWFARRPAPQPESRRAAAWR